MKLVSKRGSRVSNDSEPKNDIKTEIDKPQISEQIDDVQNIIQSLASPDDVQLTVPDIKLPQEQESVQSVEKPEAASGPKTTPVPVQIPKPIYPEATLSDKQMEALKRVIGPSSQDVSGDFDMGSVDPYGKNDGTPLSGKKKKKKKKTINNPDEIVIKDRSVVKTVFFVIFLVLILLAAGAAGFYYWWTEYATFDYELQPIVILEGQSITPDIFIDPDENAEGLNVVFQNPDVDLIVGLQYIPLTLQLGLRTVDTSAVIFVLAPIESIEHEFAEPGAVLRPVDFLANPDAAARVSSFDIRFTETPLLLEEYQVGEFSLHLALNDVPFDVSLYVVDTTPPKATSVNQTINIGEEVSAEDFVTDVFDASPITSIKFVDQPDTNSREEEQTVKVIIEDYFGNSAVFSAVLTIQFNQFPPVIEGVPEFIESEIGTPIDFPVDMTAYDDFGRELIVHVDDSTVDLNTEGTYSITVWAEDLSGQRSEEEMTIYIIGASPEYIYQRADDILSSVIRANMTQVQKVRAINEWIRWTLKSSTAESDSGSPSLLASAYRGIENKRGDPFVFAAVSELLLTRAGIPNMRIERIAEADTEFAWNLVNPDERGWHHFDTFPNSLGLGSGNVSMFTGSQAKAFAERIESRSKIKNYYTYDPELYPEIVQGD